jgi:hypothetical protein
MVTIICPDSVATCTSTPPSAQRLALHPGNRFGPGIDQYAGDIHEFATLLCTGRPVAVPVPSGTDRYILRQTDTLSLSQKLFLDTNQAEKNMRSSGRLRRATIRGWRRAGAGAMHARSGLPEGDAHAASGRRQRSDWCREACGHSLQEAAGQMTGHAEDSEKKTRNRSSASFQFLVPASAVRPAS